METYLQEMTNLMSLRLKERTLSSIKDLVAESVQNKIKDSKQQVIDELKKSGLTDEKSLDAAIKSISTTVTEEFLRTEGSALLTKVPEIIQSEALKLGEELALAVKEATSLAAAEVLLELSGKKS